MPIRDRIKEFKRVPASQLKANPKNWRTHPEGQQAALKGMLAEVGIADACIARELEDGTLELIDGHLRTDVLDDEVPVLVLDVTAAEAEKLLLTLDPLAGMAMTDTDALHSLMAEHQLPIAIRESLESLTERFQAELGELPEMNEHRDSLASRTYVLTVEQSTEIDEVLGQVQKSKTMNLEENPNENGAALMHVIRSFNP